MSYNGNSEVESIYYYLNYTDSASTYCLSLNYFYDRFPDGKIDNASISVLASTGSDSYDYDSFDRVSEKHIYMHSNANSAIFFDNDVAYSYKSNSSGSNTSGLVETYSSTVNQGTATVYTYTYDSNGYITKITDANGVEIRYVYDDLGQLIREDNEYISRTYVYTYDNAGNITSKISYYCCEASETPAGSTGSYAYNYTNSEWGDLLTGQDGMAIQYDSIGNPTFYKGKRFTWEGRSLVAYTSKGITYTYNDEGIRTSKTKNGVTTTYYLNGSQIVAEETNGDITVYAYDASGSPMGMQYKGSSSTTWEIYWYEKNLQGDIIAVYNEAGTKLVSYVYDAWGGAWYTSHNNGSNTKAWDNPFLYRGYYYDRDLGFYYLNSRYYDAETGRFINADGTLYHNMLGYNLYAYCNNNPVNFTDYTGESPELALMAFLVKYAPVVIAATEAALVVAAVLVVAAAVDIIVNAVEDAAENVQQSENNEAKSNQLVENVPTNNSNLTPPPEEDENQKALRKIVTEVLKNVKRGKFISEKEARILDEWCEDYKIPQHHKAQIGSGKHWKMRWDHTHFYNKHIPFK